MNARRVGLAVAVLFLVAGCNKGQGGQAARGGGPAEGGVVKAGEYRVSGPYEHENLSVFLIHGPESMPGRTYLTLGEAMEQKKVVVHESGQVNQLWIENVSPDEDVYVQSGDIVKGGKQDRLIAYDLIVPGKSGRLSLDAFCVEQGRWQQRGREDVTRFYSSNYNAPSKSVKMAAKGYGGGQDGVWAGVESQQRMMTTNAGGSVRATTSPSSYQLSLESGAVRDKAGDYVKALKGVTEGKGDVVGYAFAINGKVNSADVYASRALFGKLWPRLLEASAVEAFAEWKQGAAYGPAKAEDVAATLADAEKGKASHKDLSGRTAFVTHESDGSLMFECRDKGAGGNWLHRNYTTRDAEAERGRTPQRGHDGGQLPNVGGTQINVNGDMNWDNRPDGIYNLPATQPATSPATRPAGNPIR